tara:strand:- start:15468 stop:15905 length:438 start_codon:yes stop_codon:yes gene_type:complete
MSVTVADYINKLDQVRNNIPNIVSKSVAINEEAIIHLNTQVQLYNEGIDSNNIVLAPYSKDTIFIKQSNNQPYDRTTLKDTGDFYRGFKLIFTSNHLFITSTDDKTDLLMGKYGTNIFGLTPDNQLTLYNEILLPDICDYLREKL